jgi:hypothetical protein
MKRLLLLLLLSLPGFAQITFEPRPHLIQTDTVAAASLAFRANVTSGDLLVVSYHDESNATETISDTLATSYTEVVTSFE